MKNYCTGGKNRLTQAESYNPGQRSWSYVVEAWNLKRWDKLELKKENE
jgi:hypothetical protein